MDKKRAEVLSKKVSKVRSDFEKWIAENKFLLPGEVAVIDVYVQKMPSVIAKVKGKKSRLLTNTEKEIEPKDWENILTIPFLKKERAIIELFHKNGNKPLFPIEIEKSLLAQFDERNAHLASLSVYSLNTQFSKRGYSYRLREAGKSRVEREHWGKYPFKFFIVDIS